MLALLLLDVLTPPFRQVDAYLAGLNDYATLRISNATAYYRLNNRCFAYDLAHFRPKWQTNLPESDFRAQSLVVGKAVYVGTKGRLLALDPLTGKTLWSLHSTGSAVAIAADAHTLVAQLRPKEMAAVDLTTRRILWRRPLPKPRPGGIDGIEGATIHSSPQGSKTLLVVSGTTLVAHDAASGKQLWLRPDTYVENGVLPIVNETLWIGPEGRNLRTGRIDWTSPKSSVTDYAGTLNGNFVGIGHGKVFALSSTNGKTLWSHEIGPSDTSGGNQYGAVLSGRLFVRGIRQGMALNASGKPLWQQPAGTMVGQPLWTDGNAFVTYDAGRFVRYVPGAEAPVPATPEARRQEAARLVARFDKLDAAGVKRLQALGADAFAPMFDAFVQAARASDAAKGQESFALYSKYHDLAQAMDRIVDEDHVPELTAALKAAKPEGSEKPFIMGWLGRVGSPGDIVPLFLKELESKTPGFEMYESNTFVARSYIIRSDHPLAVRFMIDKLNDPAADPVLRKEAYWRLAGTGGEAGLRAVLAHRHTRQLLKPLSERLNLADVGKAPREGKVSTLVAERKDPRTNRTWALLRSGILGSSGDLWLVEKIGTGYGNPVFTGVTLDGISRWNKTKLPEPKFAGKTAKELAAGAWFVTLVGNPDLDKDADQDGLTDLVEARLGTSPTKSDTDADGDRDDVDPWPNVAARPKTDAERVLAAAFEARYWGEEYPGVALMSEKFAPFEMPGRRGPVMFDRDHRDFAGSLSRHYEQGVAMIGISGPEKSTDPRGDSIAWNPDRTEATVRISTYYGGLNGTGYKAVVRKFGSEWVVVSMDMEFVS